MTASFTLVLDTRAPANPTMLLNGGASTTAEQDIWVYLTTADYLTGANDVAEMKIWGDVDPTADPAFTIAEADAQWLPYTEQVAVMLSSGDDRKYLYARLRDDVGNQTLPVSGFIDLNTTLPAVEVITAVDRSRISTVAPYNAATFTWQVNQPVLSYQVRIVPSLGSPFQSGVPLGTAGGSVNVAATERIESLTPVTTTVTGTDLATASPGDATKVCKVFVQNLDGAWSP